MAKLKCQERPMRAEMTNGPKSKSHLLRAKMRYTGEPKEGISMIEPSQGNQPERAHDILRLDQPLDAFFAPKNVAVVGATETAGSVGRTIVWNLLSSPFGGAVFPVNPKRKSVLGIKAYPSIAELPDAVDLAVIVTPATAVPAIVRQCIDAGVKACIIISAGFKEAGPAGAELESQVRRELASGRMRVIGPNCLGVMCPVTGLNATFAATMVRPGNVAFISQSGALLTAILDWSLREGVGFSAFASLGSMLDVGWGDLIDYLGNDPHTHSIVIYMESIGDAHSFLSAAREVALRKPIIVIKAGRTEAAAKAAASHTGALTGSDEVLEAAFRRCGVLRVRSIADLFYMAEVLGKQPRPAGPRLTIVTNAGGPGVLATDALITDGAQLATLSPQTIESLNTVLPPHWSHNNPIDILGDAAPERYAKAIEIAAADPESDGLLVILTPQAMTDPTQTAEKLKPLARIGKPLLASWMGGSDVAAGQAILNHAGIPTFSYPDSAARAFVYMWRSTYNLRGLYETPALPRNSATAPAADVAKILNSARQANRTLLTEVEAKQLLAAYGIPTVPTRVATSKEQAVEQAREFGFPVVLKLYSETITHKTDVGGVQLNLRDDDAVRRAWQNIVAGVTKAAGAEHFAGVTVQPMIKLDGYELIIGSSIDPQFGPVILFGLGGQLVEVFRDRALALPPLNSTLARRLMEQTRIYTALKGVRGRDSVDLAALAELLVRFSQLIIEQPWIAELDINPLLASSERLIALDARVVLHPPQTPESELPRPCIRPYPSQYASPWTLRDGTRVTIRPIRPEDEPLLVKFHESLSEQTVYFRYFQALKLSQRVAHERLSRMCFIDYSRELALVAELGNERGEAEIIGVGRLTKLPRGDGEFALLITDRFQRHGLGSELLSRLLRYAQDEGLRRVHGHILRDNPGMQHVVRKLGFELCVVDHAEVKAELTLGQHGG